MVYILCWFRSLRVEFIRAAAPFGRLVVLSLLAWLGGACRVYDSDLIDYVRPPGARSASVDSHIISDVSAVYSPQPDTPLSDDAGEPEEAALDAGPKDECPDDPQKTSPGKCGCGVRDDDDDGDGTLNCSDACPHDPKKARPGTCGCGRSEADGDGDGTLDCLDGCPADPHKSSPGLCGCGVGDPPPSAAAPADELCTHPPLVHRYRFDGAGSELVDAIGAANGTIFGGSHAVLDAGVLALAGGSVQGSENQGYVALPSQVWQGLGSATFELWVVWRGQATGGKSEWQRLLDVGDQVAGQAHTYLFLTPNGKGGVRSAFSLNASDPNSEVSITTLQPLPTNTLEHLAMVVDETAETLTLYIDATAQGSVHLPARLSAINAQNVWLGRSNFREDPDLYGDLYEFRIYASALTPRELRASFNAGPDAEIAQ
jgi:hypothetical protein